MNKVLLVLLMFMTLASCASHRATGTIKEQRLIEPDQKITIIWDVGSFCNNPSVNCGMLSGTVNSKHYVACTKLHLERAFGRNGYTAKAVKVYAASLKATPIDTPYVLVLRNVSAKFKGTVSRSSPSLNQGLLTRLLVESELYDGKTRRLLWQGNSYWANDAKYNGTPTLLLVRALAADGFLKLKAENVVDYQGNKTWPNDAADGCPE
ncbi:MAG: hypothetical protein R8K20_00420 [Gallionellaceae bacterium]